MQLVERPTEAREPQISVGASLAVELSWILLAAAEDKLCVDHPALARLYGQHPAMRDEVRSFWGDGVDDFGELLVLADQARVIGSTDVDEFAAAVPAAAASTPSDLPLASERPEDRAVFLGRIEALGRSTKRRSAYSRLISGAWAGVAADWEAFGRAATATASERYRRRLERGARWVDLVIADSSHLSKLLPELAGLVPPEGSVTIAPSYFSGQGLVFDLPGRLLVGVHAQQSRAEDRSRTDPVAKRLKAIADPTRLAIVDYLAGGARTVGEVAQAFELAQPTVSNHVKVLRDAGVIVGERRGSRLELMLDRQAADALVDELRSIVAPTTEPPPASEPH